MYPIPSSAKPTITPSRNAMALRFLFVLVCAWMVAPMLRAQMPREDVIEVPSISGGLCVSNLFQSNMVWQRGKPLVVWGWAAPGEEVTVSFAGAEGKGVTEPDRRWRVELPAQPASSEPRQVTVRGASKSLVLENVLVGDVWVLGGQSNMEFELDKVENGELEIATANYAQIRILTVPYAEGPELRLGFARLHQWSDWFGRHFRKGDWDVCSPEVVRELSAIGYVFARRVHMASGVPIGVIDASRGGTSLEAWTPELVLRAMDSERVRRVLAEWDTKVAEWDPAADLERRVKRHEEEIELLRAESWNDRGHAKPAPTDLRPGPIADRNFPGSSYAGMLGPLKGLPIEGVIFHQGFTNSFQGTPGVEFYRDVFPGMIAAWRATFGDPELPFGILSLCTEGEPQTQDNYVEMMLNAGIHIRAVQYQTFLDLWRTGDQNIGFASTFDLRRRWYHPQVKLPAGERIARWALSTQYGFGSKLLWKPPFLEAMEQQDNALLLRLDSLVGDPEDGAITGFAIAGPDRRFQPANVSYVPVGEDDQGRPRFDHKQLLLTSPMVPGPIHFRYAWGRNPLANLQATGNKDLPFATQRSDDWDMGTVPLNVLEEELDGMLSPEQQNRVLQALRDLDKRRRLEEAKALLGSSK